MRGNVEQRSLLQNQRRFFLQRAESSMYALRRTIYNFGDRIRQMQQRLNNVTPTADGLKEFLLLHYGFKSEKTRNEYFDFSNSNSEAWDEYSEEEDEEETEVEQQKRSSLRRSIDLVTDSLRSQSDKAQAIYHQMLTDCEGDLLQLEQIQNLLAGEFAIDHKREQVTRKVQELVSQGHKVLLISTFSDTVIDYYSYMTRNSAIASKGIGMVIGAAKTYHKHGSSQPVNISPINALQGDRYQTNLKRQQIFRLFAPAATCKTIGDRPKKAEELSVLIGSETLSVGQNLQDADYLINIDLPWNPMVLEQRIGRIDRPKQHKVENIYVYYANSESQLLRQASRLTNLHKKLVGELESNNGAIPSIPSIDKLGASVYGDTLFDDEVLPGYIDFLGSLVKVRQMEQGNLQEATYQKQETSRDLYTHNEILHSEELGKLVEQLGEDYQACPISLGRVAGELDEPEALLALTIDYFGPNGEPIADRRQTLYWNDRTGEKDAYGIAIAQAFKTPVAGNVFSTTHILEVAQKLYNQLVALKHQRVTQIKQPETLENITITSDRISKINRRVSILDGFPAGLDRATVKNTFKKLNAWKEIKGVQKLLREYTDGDKATLDDATFVIQLVQDTDKLNLIAQDGIKPSSLQVSLVALLVRA